MKVIFLSTIVAMRCCDEVEIEEIGGAINYFYLRQLVCKKIYRTRRSLIMELVSKEQGVGNNLITENDVISHQADLFRGSAQEVSMVDGTQIIFRRLHDNNDGPYEFNLTPQGMQYLQLSSARLFIEGKIVDDEMKPLVAASDGLVALANLPGAAMFSSVEITIDGVPYPELSNRYSNYKGYLETVLTYSPETANGHLAAAHFYMDTPLKFSDFKKESENVGFKKRASLTDRSQIIQISCPLPSDFFQIDRFFPPGSKITIKLTKADDRFFICSGDVAEKKYKFQIDDMYLTVRHINMCQEIIEKHGKDFDSKYIVLPYNKTAIMTHSIGQGSTALHLANLVQGTLPKSVIIGFVAAANFHGTYKSSPWEFINCNMSEIYLNVLGQSVPSKPFTPKFPNQTVREVNLLFYFFLLKCYYVTIFFIVSRIL